MEIGEESFRERIIWVEEILKGMNELEGIKTIYNLGNKLETIPKNNKICQKLQKCHPGVIWPNRPDLNMRELGPRCVGNVHPSGNLAVWPSL